MIPRLLPQDINVEDLLIYMPPKSFYLSIEGLHKRNSYNDIVEIEDHTNNIPTIHLGRNSLYNSLPEYMFHFINRFDNLHKYNEKERFTEECQKQEKEIYNARKFFQPLDILLLNLRITVKKHIDKYITENKTIIDILSDDLTMEQKENRFIKKTLIFLPKCKNIRGNKTLLTLMLRKVFLEDNIIIEKRNQNLKFKDSTPRYEESIDSPLSNLYVGNVYNENTLTYTIHYWSDNDCNEQFLLFIKETEVFKQFIQDYFISVEELISFEISHDKSSARLSDTTIYNYLNYNVNI